jgi:hypothetical protein
MAVGVSEGLSRESLFRVLLRLSALSRAPFSLIGGGDDLFLYFSHWRDCNERPQNLETAYYLCPVGLALHSALVFRSQQSARSHHHNSHSR